MKGVYCISMANYLFMSMCLAPELSRFETSKIIFFVLSLILFIGFCSFWKKMKVSVFLPSLFIIFLHTPWGQALYEKLTNMVNESTAMFSGLMKIPQWTVSYQTVLSFLTLIFFLYLSYQLITRISNGTMFVGFLVASGIMLLKEDKMGIGSVMNEVNVETLFRYNIFQKLLENYRAIKNISLSEPESLLLSVCVVGLALLAIFLSWKLARSYEWKRISKELQVKWYQVVLFVLLLTLPVMAMLVIGFLPYEHRTFQVGYVRKFKGKKLTEKDTQGTQDVIDVTDNLQKDVYVHNQPTSEAEDEENDNSANQQNVTL